jgi:superfamily II DNA/RNA helicase
MMGAAKEGGHLQKLLSVHTRPEQRQTILASATIPQHRRFLQDCVQNKWTKENVVYTHIQPEEKIPSYLHHRYVVCEKDDRLQVLFSVLKEDAPDAAIIFVNDQVVFLLPPLGLRFYAFLSRFVLGCHGEP